ncbi:MAG: GntR family transcriptional regulator [Caenispirillum bisanense]|uniref:Transcriptional regulator, GntR family n=1 Tax=Caenispirillum bisanense TaxID=414052 RepID=A0A286GFD5_9PROT|nr:GntR family transcriptional regulator [Caenispirillum bisanense]MCA1971716.1 GntR family transcriptional regulator [Caenispirillum sp.]SOD94218.1 transcriptional regulator, GntR family [Caenispirillum bisanense]
MPRRTPTRADQLRRALEEDIFAGRLKPGDRLDEQSLAQRFDVSRTPVREALRQLSASGLIEVRPRQGAVVAVITLPRLVEMFEVMAELEAMCARLAARRMNPAEREALKKVVRDCEGFEKKIDLEGYYAANKVFHDAIYDGSHNEVLAEMTRTLHRRTAPYRRHQLNRPGRISESLAEHKQVVDAILAYDADAASRLMARHVNVQGDVFTDFISTLPQGYVA